MVKGEQNHRKNIDANGSRRKKTSYRIVPTNWPLFTSSRALKLVRITSVGWVILILMMVMTVLMIMIMLLMIMILKILFHANGKGRALGTRTCIKRKKIDYGNFFIFVHKKCIKLDSGRSKLGHYRVLRKGIFLTFTHEKTTFRWSKVVSEAIFPTNYGYVCIQK